MKMSNSLLINQRWHQQSGAVLILSLVLILITGIIATSVMRTSVMEVKMVANTQFKEEAFQKAESIINAISADQDNFVVTGGIGHTTCAIGGSSANCNNFSIALPSEVTNVNSSVGLDYFIERKGPLFAPIPFREHDTRASGANSFNVAIFEVVAEYDGREKRLGYQEIWQGVAIKIAAANQ